LAHSERREEKIYYFLNVVEGKRNILEPIRPPYIQYIINYRYPIRGRRQKNGNNRILGEKTIYKQVPIRAIIAVGRLID
jgi:hypothetical protein